MKEGRGEQRQGDSRPLYLTDGMADRAVIKVVVYAVATLAMGILVPCNLIIGDLFCGAVLLLALEYKKCAMG